MSRLQDHSAAGRIRSTEKIHLKGNLTRDLPACCIVPQPTMVPLSMVYGSEVVFGCSSLTTPNATDFFTLVKNPELFYVCSVNLAQLEYIITIKIHLFQIIFQFKWRWIAIHKLRVDVLMLHTYKLFKMIHSLNFFSLYIIWVSLFYISFLYMRVIFSKMSSSFHSVVFLTRSNWIHKINISPLKNSY
jgi:hypothetical protein